METVYFRKINQVKREKEHLEKKLNVTLQIVGKKVVLEGSPLDEYEATIVLEAIQFGFSIAKALLLKDDQLIFRKLSIKQFTRRKNLEEVRARIIGTEGKTKHTIEEISRCLIVINENTVGIIGSAEGIEEATTALMNLIRGSKQANVYRFLERMNAAKKRIYPEIERKKKRDEHYYKK